MSESTFRGLLKDLAVFFGTVSAFVGGFLLVSYVAAPSRNPYGFWLGFLLYMYVFSKAVRWGLHRRGKKPSSPR
jgi:Na+-driven multidrug efflux pump